MVREVSLGKDIEIETCRMTKRWLGERGGKGREESLLCTKQRQKDSSEL